MVSTRLLIVGLLLCSAWGPVGADDMPPVRMPPDGRGVPVVGQIVWPGHDLGDTQLRIYADARRKDLVDVFATGGPSGAIAFTLDPGTYYLMVFSDQDGDKKASPGDGLGFYGVADARSEPQPLVVDKGGSTIALAISIAFTIGADGRSPQPIAVRAPKPHTATRETPIWGRVTGMFDERADRFVLVIPLSPLFPPRAARIAPDGSYEVSVVPGTYHLIATENLNGSGAIDAGDLIGVPHYEPTMGPSLPTVKAGRDQEVRNLDLDLRWALARDGRLRSGDGCVLGPRLSPAGLPAICMGTVTQSGEPIAGAIVKAYADRDLKELHYTTLTGPDGTFCLGTAAATYYLVTVRDVDGDGATGAGDEIGFFGVRAGALDGAPQPEPLALRPGELRRNVDIPLVLAIDDQNKPVPLTAP